jgi:hypothetical protein
MKTFAVGTAFAVVLGLAGLVEAAQLLSPPLPTGVGTSGSCFIRNTGASSINVQVSIVSNNGSVLVFDGCYDAPLRAGRTCQVLVDLPDASYAACSVTAATVSKLRGTFEIRGPYPTPGFPSGLLRVLVAEELQ